MRRWIRLKTGPLIWGTHDDLLLYCQQGGRTVQAYQRLQGELQGRVSLLQGGYEAWLKDTGAQTSAT